MVSNARGSATPVDWSGLGRGAVFFALALALLVLGCRSTGLNPASTPPTTVLAPPQATSLDDLATAVARVLDDRGRNLPAPATRSEAAAGDPQLQRAEARPPSTNPAPALVPAPAPIEVGRMSMDELSAVVEQILRDKQLVAAGDRQLVPGPPQGMSPTAPRPLNPADLADPVAPPEATRARASTAAGPVTRVDDADRSERLTALVARMLREQQSRAGAAADAGDPSRFTAAPRATPLLDSPAPTSPDRERPRTPAEAVSDEDVARVVLRVLQEQQGLAAQATGTGGVRAAAPAPSRRSPVAATPSPGRSVAPVPARTVPSRPVDASAASPQAGQSISIEELTRAVERVLRDGEGAALPQPEPPRAADPAPAGIPSSWNPGSPSATTDSDGSGKLVVRMQSSSLVQDDSLNSPLPVPSSRQVPEPVALASEKDLARAIALVLRSRAARGRPGTTATPDRPEPARLGAPPLPDPRASDAESPVPQPSPESSFSPPDRPPRRDGAHASPMKVDELARQVALIIKSRAVGQADSIGRRDGATGAPPGLPAPDKSMPLATSAQPPGRKPGNGPTWATAEGETIAASVGGDPFAFKNPFDRDPGVVRAACAACGEAHLGPSALGDPTGSGGCGQLPCAGRSCYPFPAHTAFGRFFGELYESICCPDPCYQPEWLPLANSAFFVDGIRPVTQGRIRYNFMGDLRAPDRNEFIWARADGMGTGPTPRLGRAKAFRRGQGIDLRSNFFLPQIDFNEVSLYTEAANAAGTFSAFTEIPYREVDSHFYPHGSGFSNINVGTKSILFDSPLLQLAFQFRTYIPLGPSSRGLGVGHVSLEPSLIAALRLSARSYLQAQLAEWIPLGGTPDWQGSLMHYHFSLNHQLWQLNPDIPLIGTLEFNGWSFQTGGYSAFAFGSTSGGPSQLYTVRLGSSGNTYASLATGLRLVVCRKVDGGVAVAYPLDSPNWAYPQVLAEFRWRF
jgi:hypothetical protein